MNWIISLIFIIIIAGLTHKILLLLKYKKEQLSNKNTESTMVLEEQARRERILSEIHHFLTSAQFFEPVAKWRDEDIYRYILNEGYLYEFEEIMPPAHQRIGRDEEYLCFKQLTYKRVMNPEEFFSKYRVKNPPIHIIA